MFIMVSKTDAKKKKKNLMKMAGGAWKGYNNSRQPVQTSSVQERVASFVYSFI